jgi:2-hydroxy-6-oxonona-2,4-dienedioate hydrolase
MVERAEFESRYTQVQSDSLSFRIHSLCSRDGSAESLPVVFVPGLGASCRTMLPTARLVPDRRDVFIVDLPSQGESARPSRPLSLAGYAAVAVAWLDALQLERAVLVGHSFGSQVLVELAVDHPALVEGLVLISPTVDSHARTIASQLARLLLDAIHEPPGLVRALLRDYLTTGFRGLRDLGRTAIRDRMEDKLPSIEAPTLVVRGGRDPLVPERWAKQIASLLPHPKLVVIPNGTHAVQYQSPVAVARALQEFLTELTGSLSSAT